MTEISAGKINKEEHVFKSTSGVCNIHTVIWYPDKEKYEKWVKSGALITEAVKKLMENKYEYIKYDPKKIKEEKENAKKMVEYILSLKK